MTNKFYLPIGDWSNDGHGLYENILIQSNGSLNDIREAHFKIEEKTGVNIHKVANHYGDDTLTDQTLQQLTDLGIVLSPYFMGEDILEPDEIAQIWIDLLNITDTSLKIEKYEDKNKIESISFFGYDDKQRHIDFVGYGTFDV